MADDFLDLLSEDLEPAQTGVRLYHDNPAGFVKHCIKWKPGEAPAKYQLGNVDLLAKRKRIVVRAPRRAGKTASNAMTILWFALTRDAAGEDWMIVVTAAVFRQLKAFLWGQLSTKWVTRLDWEKIGRKPFNSMELMREELRLKHGSVVLAATSDPAKIEGAHADEVLFIFDEAKAIPDTTFDSAEGTFAGAGDDTRVNAYVLVTSTPGPPEGRFYDLCTAAQGYDSYERIHITLKEVIESGQVSPERVKEYEERYGKESVWFLNHVLGEFADEGTDGVIPWHWLEAAEERWLERFDAKDASRSQMVLPIAADLEPLHSVGVDLGFGGKDRSVYALRHGEVVSTLIWRPRVKDTKQPAGEVAGILRSAEHQPLAVVDAGSAGLGVFDELRTQGYNAEAFMAQDGAPGRTKEGIYEFGNKRAAAWWNLRELLDPTSGHEICIPPDEHLRGDLLAPHWKVNASGKIFIEEKKDIRKRLKRSTDAGDAVVQAYWGMRMAAFAHAPVFGDIPSSSRSALTRPGIMPSVF